MCGICGIAGITPQDSNSIDIVLDQLERRGPDDRGKISFGSVTLGHTRLAIQDVELGKQPMQSWSRKNTLVFNGEIYNHFELRKLLPNLAWKSNSDTETVVELVEAFGVGVIEKFVGMFAFGIWNAENLELTLARDGCGEKPLYYSLKGRSLAFSSDPGGIPRLLHDENVIDSAQLPYFLKYGYIHYESSTHAKVFMLLPGHVLKWRSQSASVTQLINLNSNKKNIKFDQKTLRSKIEIAVERTLLADERVGVMLSGGLDSSIIAALASKSCKDLPTFTVSLTEDSEDRKYAKELARRFKTDHHEIFINPSQLAEKIEEVVTNLPQPFADSAIIPTYILSKIANQEVKVLLSGDGADEVFAGYGYYEKYRILDQITTSKYESYLKQFRYEISKNSRSKRVNRNREEFRKSLLTSKRISPKDSWNQDLSAFTDNELNRIFKSNLSKIEKGTFITGAMNSPFWDVLIADRRSYLAGDILRKSDMGGMLASVEIRSPYLDKDLNQYLSDSIVNPKELHKGILFKACSDLIPNNVYERKKQGFGAPLDEWFSYPEVAKLISGTLTNQKAKIYDFFEFESSMKCIETSRLKKWNFFTLALWLEKHD